jgi:mRNA interferase HigB
MSSCHAWLLSSGNRDNNIIRKTDWANLEVVRETYREAEAVGNFTVFNIKGNRYRLIVDIDYESGTVYYN